MYAQRHHASCDWERRHVSKDSSVLVTRRKSDVLRLYKALGKTRRMPVCTKGDMRQGL